MRDKLGEIGSSERHLFTAEFVRYGIKSGWKGDLPTVLFKDVKFGDRIVADHLWFNCGKQFDRIDLECGDIVEFSARVDSYIKGYFGNDEDICEKKPIEEDWKLSFPTKVRKIGRNEHPAKPIPPRPRDGESQTSLESHANRVDAARRFLRASPPKYAATFVDGVGNEICRVDTIEAIWEKLGVNKLQWECFFRGMVGFLGKGDAIELRFKKRTKKNPAPPYYQYGVVMERTRHCKTKVEGYGFIRAAYVVGWNNHSPFYIASHKDVFDGGIFGKHDEKMTYIPLGGISDWEMEVVGDDNWKKTFEERREKISSDVN